MSKSGVSRPASRKRSRNQGSAGRHVRVPFSPALPREGALRAVPWGSTQSTRLCVRTASCQAKGGYGSCGRGQACLARAHAHLSLPPSMCVCARGNALGQRTVPASGRVARWPGAAVNHACAERRIKHRAAFVPREKCPHKWPVALSCAMAPAVRLQPGPFAGQWGPCAHQRKRGGPFCRSLGTLGASTQAGRVPRYAYRFGPCPRHTHMFTPTRVVYQKPLLGPIRPNALPKGPRWV